MDEDVPLEIVGPLGCGIQTGAGAVMNALEPEPGSSIVVFGVGSVGISSVMAAEAVEELATDVGIPHGLAEVGVTRDELPRFAEATMQLQRLLAGNPRRLTAEDAGEIFRRSL